MTTHQNDPTTRQVQKFASFHCAKLRMLTDPLGGMIINLIKSSLSMAWIKEDKWIRPKII